MLRLASGNPLYKPLGRAEYVPTHIKLWPAPVTNKRSLPSYLYPLRPVCNFDNQCVKAPEEKQVSRLPSSHRYLPLTSMLSGHCNETRVRVEANPNCVRRPLCCLPCGMYLVVHTYICTWFPLCVSVGVWRLYLLHAGGVTAPSSGRTDDRRHMTVDDSVNEG